MDIDPYKLLGVGRRANLETIKRRHRELVMECHPDRCPGDEAAAARFKQIQEAFELLADPESRRVFDQTGERPSRVSGVERQQAMSLLARVLEAFINAAIQQRCDPTEVDVVAQMREALRGSMQDGRGKLDDLRARRDHLLAVAARFRIDGDADEMLAAIATAPVAQLEEQIRNFDLQMSTHERALTLLESRSFSVRHAARGAMGPTWTIGTSKRSI